MSNPAFDSLEADIRARLAPLQASVLTVVDQSAAHAGHAGARSGAHVHLDIVSPCFATGLRVDRHRLVYELLGDLMQTRIHALSLNAQVSS
jgi:BolA protein